ncbi:MFS transporter [Halobellus ordinarius]|uniref:MFS transporter n=1 Tax=Halobellus ordinarius TaxID=3075120 RepID=UPI002880A12B|nr:MFS transporter [Halobellus sp. ZY16]
MTETEPDALDSLTSWLIVALGLVILILDWGLIFTFTVYSEALASAFGLSGLRVSSVFSITIAVFYIAGGLIGVVIARLPLRPVVATAGGVFAVAVGLLQITSSYLGLAATFALIGMAGGTMFVVVISLVPQWFDQYQGRAMGITMTGNGLGIFVLPPVWVWLLERTDIRSAFVVVGGVTAATILLASLLYRRPSGRAAAHGVPVNVSWLRGNLTDPPFVAAVVGFALLWSWYFGLSADLVGILTANGIERTVAATAFGIVGVVSVAARVASGEFADRIGMRITLTFGVVLASLAMGVLPVISAPLPMYVLLVVFGIGLGAIAPLFSPIIIDRFGPANATAIVGIFTAAQAATAFSVPIVLNVLTEGTGSNAPPLLLIGGATLLGAGLFYRGTAPESGNNAEDDGVPDSDPA